MTETALLPQHMHEEDSGTIKRRPNEWRAPAVIERRHNRWPKSTFEYLPPLRVSTANPEALYTLNLRLQGLVRVCNNARIGLRTTRYSRDNYPGGNVNLRANNYQGGRKLN